MDEDNDQWIHVGKRIKEYVYEITDVLFYFDGSSIIFKLYSGLETVCKLQLYSGSGDTHPKIVIFEDGEQLAVIHNEYWNLFYFASKTPNHLSIVSCKKDQETQDIFKNIFRKFRQDIIGTTLISSKISSTNSIPYSIDIVLKLNDETLRKLIVVPSFSSCKECKADKRIKALFKIKKQGKTIVRPTVLNHVEHVTFEKDYSLKNK
jgi:hypothetical protein